MSKLSEELKEAIVRIPQKEKDKLLLKLVAKDDNLIQRLEFELVEQGDTLQLRRDDIKKRILKVAKMTHDTPGWMMMDMRSFSGDISQHVKVTKDKYGDVELNLYLLNTFFDHQLELLRVHNSRSDSCAEYIAKKTVTVLKNLEKMNADFYVDFASDVQKLLDRVHQYCPKNYARQMGIVNSWP
ncbi:MAG: hypothetical protein MUE30_02255 [Spirosomaceae bacterium]|jgi:hypothetical protein|nr:hypothetical protein [Spirosomataceae bacterium]